MFNWLILGHIIFGLVAFAGSLLLALGFRTSFH
ncbi:MAG: Na+-transporting malonate decarboxylase, carboxybiotin decarboxylase subunit, madB, partial [Lacticaseibacillus sp.]